MNRFLGGGCIAAGDASGEGEEFDSAGVGADGHVHMLLVPILLSWLRELAGLTTIHEFAVEANRLEDEELPVDVVDAGEFIVDELL